MLLIVFASSAAKGQAKIHSLLPRLATHNDDLNQSLQINNQSERDANLRDGISVTANSPSLRAAKPRGNPKGICIAEPDLVESDFFHLAKN